MAELAKDWRQELIKAAKRAYVAYSTGELGELEEAMELLAMAIREVENGT